VTKGVITEGVMNTRGFAQSIRSLMVTSAIIDVRAEVNEGRREKQVVDAGSSVRVHGVPCISKLRFMSIVPDLYQN